MDIKPGLSRSERRPQICLDFVFRKPNSLEKFGRMMEESKGRGFMDTDKMISV